MSTFVKAARSETASFLDFNPNANHLLNVIARRARRTDCKLNNLSVGECFIGFKSVGLTEQQYRTAKKHLQKIGLVSFRVARKLTGGVTSGVTVAKLMDSRVYDINIEEGNANLTPSQRQLNANLTSIKNVKNEKNVKKIDKRFTPPTDIETVSYFEEKGSTASEAEKFWFFYDSKNWMVGKSKMKRWQSAASGWIKRNKTESKDIMQISNDSDWHLQDQGF